MSYEISVKMYAEDNMSLCPCCGSRVSIMTSRDLNVLPYYVDCINEDCELTVFHTECHIRQSLPQSSINNIKTMYNEWCDTNPEQWCEDQWDHYTRGSNWFCEKDYNTFDV